MEDLHGFGDDGAGVDLAVDPHDEGLVEQDVCVFCQEGGGYMGQNMQPPLGWVMCRRGAWPHLGTEARTPAGS